MEDSSSEERWLLVATRSQYAELVAKRNHLRHNEVVTSRTPSPASVGKRQACYETVRANSALMELMEREVESATGMSMGWYDVLVNLYLAPGKAMRMSDLANIVITSRSWLTRRIDQLEKAGYVERCVADADGRGVRARLTREGRLAYIRMERVHSTIVDRHFGELMTAADAAVVEKVMRRVGASARETLGLPTTG